MDEETGSGCASRALVAVELVALLIIFLSWWLPTAVSWDSQHVGPSPGPYVWSMVVVAAIAAAAGIVAEIRRAKRIARSQALVVVVTLVAMVVFDGVGTKTHRTQQQKACHAGLGASWCAEVR